MTSLALTLSDRLTRTSAYMRWACQDLTEEALRTQFDPEFSPIGWHLGHVAWQEEVWVLRGRFRLPPLYPAFDEVFDSFRPDKQRRGHALPGKQGLFEYRAEVRARVLDRLEELVKQPTIGLMEGAGLARFVANHESQHIETVLSMRLAGGLTFEAGNPANRCSGASESPASPPQEYVVMSGGTFRMGSDADPERWDNESRSHEVQVRGFCVQRYPVQNRGWLEFVQAGGYQTKNLWSKDGWRLLARTGINAPLYWSKDSEGCWHERTLAGTSPLELEQPVSHVSWHEARAFANFSGARLLREAEWEWLATRAAEHLPRDRLAAADVACRLASAHLSSAQRCVSFETGFPVQGLRGGVWEWTSDAFLPYPGFQPQAYRGYSEPWFDGSHRVARGGCHVTEPEIARATFRNWYLPEMRRAFLGLRLAKDDS